MWFTSQTLGHLVLFASQTELLIILSEAELSGAWSAWWFMKCGFHFFTRTLHIKYDKCQWNSKNYTCKQRHQTEVYSLRQECVVPRMQISIAQKNDQKNKLNGHNGISIETTYPSAVCYLITSLLSYHNCLFMHHVGVEALCCLSPAQTPKKHQMQTKCTPQTCIASSHLRLISCT